MSKLNIDNVRTWCKAVLAFSRGNAMLPGEYKRHCDAMTLVSPTTNDLAQALLDVTAERDAARTLLSVTAERLGERAAERDCEGARLSKASVTIQKQAAKLVKPRQCEDSQHDGWSSRGDATGWSRGSSNPDDY
jgi:hypothetical protein